MVEPHARQQIDILAGLVEAERAAPAFLDPVHRPLGARHQFIGIAAVAGKQGDADAAGDGEAEGVEVEGLRHRLLHALRGLLGTARIGLMNQQRELVAAQPRHRVHLAHAGLQPLGDILQHPVAVAVAQGVVDLLEAVEIDIQQSEGGTLATCHCLRVINPSGQRAAVRQAGQHVGMSEFFNALAGGQLFAQIPERIDPPDGLAPAELRQRHTLQHAPALQAQQVLALQQRRVLDSSEALRVSRAVHHAALHPGLHCLVVVRQQQVLRQRPQRGKALVEAAYAPGQIGDQNAIGGGFERRPQLGHQGLALIFTLALRGQVVQGDQPIRVARTCLDKADAPRHPKHAVIRIAHHGVGVKALCRVGGGFEPEHRVLGRARQRGDRLPQQRSLVEAQQGAGSPVHGNDAKRVGIDQPDTLPQAVQHGGIRVSLTRRWRDQAKLDEGHAASSRAWVLPLPLPLPWPLPLPFTTGSKK